MGRLIIWLGAQIKWILLSNIQLYSILKFSSWHLIQFTMIERRICKMTVFCLTVIAPHEICTICHAWFNFNCVHSSLISCNFGLLCCHYGLHELQIYCQINFANGVQCPTWKSVTGYYFLLFSFYHFSIVLIKQLYAISITNTTEPRITPIPSTANAEPKWDMFRTSGGCGGSSRNIYTNNISTVTVCQCSNTWDMSR